MTAHVNCAEALRWLRFASARDDSELESGLALDESERGLAFLEMGRIYCFDAGGRRSSSSSSGSSRATREGAATRRTRLAIAAAAMSACASVASPLNA